MYRPNVKKTLTKLNSNLQNFVLVCLFLTWTSKYPLGNIQCHYYAAFTCSKSTIKALGKDVKFICSNWCLYFYLWTNFRLVFIDINYFKTCGCRVGTKLSHWQLHSLSMVIYSFNAINGSSIQKRNCFIYFLKCRQKQVILNCSNQPCQYIVEEKPFLHTFLCIKHIFTSLKREFYGRQLCEVQLIRENYSDTIYQNKSLWPLVLGRISQERQFSRG